MTVIAVWAYIDLAQAGRHAEAAEWLPHIPAWQIAEAWSDFAPVCPARLEPPLPRRPGNALNLEVGAPLMRCSLQEPESWRGRSPGALRWIGSGGDLRVFGACNREQCPRVTGEVPS